MTKAAPLLLALALACPAFAQKAPAAAPAAAGSMELYLEAMDGQGWQWFFIADTVRRGIPAAALKIYPLVSKNEDGSFAARRGEAELTEAARLAVIGRAWPGKLLNYMNARSLSPSADGWKDAALFAGINPDELSKKAAADGQAALEAAHKRSAAAGVSETSLFLAGRRYEGSPRLMPLYEAVNASLPAARRVAPPAGYKPAPKAPPPDFWVVTAPGIKKNEQLVGVFDRYFEGIKVTEMDYSSPERSGKFPELAFVPSYILSATADAKARLANELQAGLFDEKNGFLVYEDRQRRGLYAGRAEKKNTLEVFVMSQCPFGALAENSLLDAEKNKLLPEGLDLQIHFIGDAKKDEKGAWTFTSLHGQPEWEENARQLYISKKFPDKFRAYLNERNKDYASADWQKAAAAAKVDAAAVEKNFEEAKAMLAEDFAATSALGISTSPSFVVNGRDFMVGLGELVKTPGYEKVPPPGQPSAGCAK